MLIVFALLAILPPLAIGSTTAWISSQGLRDNAFDELNSVAMLKSNAIHEWLQVLQTNLPLAFENQVVQEGVFAMLKNDEEHIISQAQLRRQLSAFNDKTGYFIEVFVLDRDGKVILSTDSAQEGKIHKNQSFFQNGLTGKFVSSPIYEVSLNSYSITLSEPIQAANDPVIGVLAARANISRLSEIMEQETGLGAFGETYLVSSNFAALTHLRNTNFELGKTYVRTQGINDALKFKAEGSAEYIDYAGKDTLGVYKWVPELQIALIAEHQKQDALATASRVVQFSMILILIGVITSLGIAVLFTRAITRPISNLVNVANNIIGHGNFQVRADVNRNDEIGVLAQAFNTMIEQLSEFIGELEQRVEERTKALTSVAEVSTAASTILETDRLLQQVVDLAKERFGFYHAHIYLLNEAGNALVLASGAGEVGRQMVTEGRSIPLDREQSLVARAAREKKGVTVNDVTTAPDFLPNPLLPDTHSELAVPMMVGEQVIGVFDVQSELIGRFTAADIAVQTTLAAQVASSIQNSRSFTEIQRSQAQLAEALTISRLGNWEYDVYKDIFTFNDPFYSIFRTTAEKVGGYKIPSADYARNFVHPDDAALVGAEIQKAMETRERYYRAALEHRIIFEDGETGYISVNVNVERDENGKIVRWYGANQDITERRRLEELNRKRAVEQETINQITQKIQSTLTIEEALQVAAREIGRALGQRPTVIAVDPAILGSEESSFAE
jgi:PAS domain S-box-containing protein